jgi:uncharacterized protein (TIGR02186 family)
MMRRHALTVALVIVATATMIGRATPETLVTSLSTHYVRITANFTGADLVLFGAIERDARTVARRGGYDVIVTVTGPRQTFVTRRRERVFGIWMNVESRTFVDAPSYLAVLSNRPLSEVSSPLVLRRLQSGLDQILLPQEISGDIGDSARDDPMRTSFVRIKRDQGLYREAPDAVTFLTPTLFRSAIPLPDNVPTGVYEIDVKLFADGALLARQTSALEVVKSGFEQFVATAARDYGFLYGIATAMMALATGWLASIVFRRD